ncbi:cytochrome c-type biogenesis protein [Pararhodobacter sp.]|jgi:cytochrome c-type biogenesis protein CcmH|uniref:cytochrome c-type biogenesis protein n=1 Tax=Pararhodobacter sp. TaxID=2127056 RepID=UPI002FDCF9C2
MRILLILLMLLAMPVMAPPAWAVQPDEVLEDPALEARARALSTGLRCVVCRNESIDESNADLARDMRIILRERLVAGDTDAEAVQYLVDRYGEYVLLSPQRDGVNLILWVSGPVLLLLGLGVAVMATRRRARPEAPLTEAEKARLNEILKQ